MSLGIKIKSPYPLSLEGAGLPSAYVSLQHYYVECKITPSHRPQCNIHKKKSQRSIATYLESKIRDNTTIQTHDLTIDIKNAGVEIEMLYASVLAILKYANHFFDRKGHPLPFQIHDITEYPSNLFHAGKFAVVAAQSVRHLPYPSGLHFSLFSHRHSYKKCPVNDQNAFIISESLYRMEFNALKLITIPNSLQQSFEEGSEYYLCLLPIVETQEVLGVFSNSAQQDRFQRRYEKMYICSAELDLDGVIVI